MLPIEKFYHSFTVLVKINESFFFFLKIKKLIKNEIL